MLMIEAHTKGALSARSPAQVPAAGGCHQGAVWVLCQGVIGDCRLYCYGIVLSLSERKHLMRSAGRLAFVNRQLQRVTMSDAEIPNRCSRRHDTHQIQVYEEQPFCGMPHLYAQKGYSHLWDGQRG